MFLPIRPFGLTQEVAVVLSAVGRPLSCTTEQYNSHVTAEVPSLQWTLPTFLEGRELASPLSVRLLGMSGGHGVLFRTIVAHVSAYPDMGVQKTTFR
jgi:hypothetical protein